MSMIEVDVSKITVPPRLRKDLGDIEELAENIRVNGLLEPIGTDKEYCLIYGYRRYSAVKRLEWKTIPCIIHDVTPDGAQLLEIEENTYRKDFTDIERVHMIGVLREIYDRGTNLVPGKFRDWASKRLNVSGGKVQQIEYLFNEATETQLESLKQGDSVNKLYAELKTPKSQPQPQPKKPKPTGSCITFCPLLEEYHLYYLAELFDIQLTDKRLVEYMDYIRKVQRRE